MFAKIGTFISGEMKISRENSKHNCDGIFDEKRKTEVNNGGSVNLSRTQNLGFEE